nr:MAG TPA: POL POLYPROTEIN [Caudoviricetes sp.]
MLIVQVPSVTLEVGTIDKDTERGKYGFNSTGIH